MQLKEIIELLDKEIKESNAVRTKDMDILKIASKEGFKNGNQLIESNVLLSAVELLKASGDPNLKDTVFLSGLRFKIIYLHSEIKVYNHMIKLVESVK